MVCGITLVWHSRRVPARFERVFLTFNLNGRGRSSLSYDGQVVTNIDISSAGVYCRIIGQEAVRSSKWILVFSGHLLGCSPTSYSIKFLQKFSLYLIGRSRRR